MFASRCKYGIDELVNDMNRKTKTIALIAVSFACIFAAQATSTVNGNSACIIEPDRYVTVYIHNADQLVSYISITVSVYSGRISWLVFDQNGFSDGFAGYRSIAGTVRAGYPYVARNTTGGGQTISVRDLSVPEFIIVLWNEGATNTSLSYDVRYWKDAPPLFNTTSWIFLGSTGALAIALIVVLARYKREKSV